MSELTNGILTTAAFAERVGLTAKRVHQLITGGVIQAEKLGRDWVIDEKYVQIILDRPERRGRPAKNKKAA